MSFLNIVLTNNTASYHDISWDDFFLQNATLGRNKNIRNKTELKSLPLIGKNLEGWFQQG